MAYTKQTWTTGETVVASKLNNIEQGIKDNFDDISTLNTNLNTALTYKGSFSGSVSDLDSYRTSDTSGIYYIPGLDIFGKSANLYGILIVYGWATVRVQVFYPSNRSYIGAVRYYSNSNWSSWYVPSISAI